MEHAAFETPLTDKQLKELGRLVINCGFVEFLLNMHVGMLFDISGPTRISLIAPLNTRRKIEILEFGLDKIPKARTRDLVDEGCKLINPTIRARNYLLHGIWGHDREGPDGKAIVASPKETQGFRTAEEISKHADNLAIASRMLKNAMITDVGGEAVEEAERLVITP